MNRFFRELRRREVFGAVGLYVGICWILIEVASVVLPTFDAPDWALRALIIAAVVGFPICVVLAWVYDFTEEGITVQADATDTVVSPIGSRKTDFVVIGVLSVALVLSLYMNVTSGPDVAEERLPLDRRSKCPAASDYSRAYIHHLIRSGEYLGAMLLSWSNTWFYQELMQAMRDARP